MKKRILTLMMLCAGMYSANAQYQVQNSNFEEWEDVTYNKTTGKEPLHWSSFLNGSGGLQSTAAAEQLFQHTEVRPGSTGSFCAKITCRYINAVIVKAYAQGNLTTGCINMGSATATNPGSSATDNNNKRGTETIAKGSGNYNWTDTSDDTHNQKFTGHPDAMHVWVKFYSPTKTYRAKAVTVLHTDGYYQDPLPKTNDCSAKLVATASNMEIAPDANKWQELTVPFVYEDSSLTPAYALVTFSTNAIPGTGTADDYMLIDDLEMLYYSELASANYDGNVVSFNGASATIDALYDESKLALESNGVGATIEKSYDEATAVLTITVKGDNISEDANNKHVYTIQFAVPSSELDMAATKYNGSVIAFEGGSATVDALYEESLLNLVPVHSTASVEKSYDEETAILTVTVKAANFAKDATNKHVYTIQFKKPVKEIEIPMVIGAKYGTFCAPFEVTEMPVFGYGEAYTVDGLKDDGTTLCLTTLSSIPAHTPVIIYCEFRETNSEVRKGLPTEGTPKAGLLTGTYEDIKAPKGSYVLQKQGEKVGFYKVEDVQPTVKAYRAYLNVDSNVKAFGFSTENGETAIKALEALTSGKPEIYDLNGRKLNKLQKGVNIVNGVKVLVK